MIDIKKLNQEHLYNLFHEDFSYESTEIEKELESWSMVDEDNSDEGKYSKYTRIFQDLYGKFYRVSVTRSGSYHSGYDWYDYEIEQVFPKKVETTYWSIKP